MKKLVLIFALSFSLIGVAKTLDTQTSARLNNPQQIYNTMKKYIDDVANFTKHDLSGVEIKADMIKHSEIRLAIPAETNAQQWQQLQRAIDYANNKGITVIVTEIVS